MPFNNPNLYVISGGPGCGKTTVLQELENLGFSCLPEDARQIIQQQMRAGGRALPWDDREAYTRLMLERSIDSYKEHVSASKPMFADRGIPDTLGYARLIGLDWIETIEDACRRFRYAPAVFMAPPWPEIYETDTERKQSFEEAERTYDVIREVYRGFDYQVIELPRDTPAARAQFMLAQIGVALA